MWGARLTSKSPHLALSLFPVFTDLTLMHCITGEVFTQGQERGYDLQPGQCVRIHGDR